MNDKRIAIWYEQYGGELLGYIRGQVGGHADADDICAQVWTEAVSKADTLDATPRAWLFQAARWRIIDWRRANDRRAAEDIDTQTVVAPEVIEYDDHAALFAQLRPSHQTILRMRLDGYSLKETAAALGLHILAAKGRQYRARAALQRLRSPKVVVPKPKRVNTRDFNNHAALLARCLRLEQEVYELKQRRDSHL